MAIEGLDCGTCEGTSVQLPVDELVEHSEIPLKVDPVSERVELVEVRDGCPGTEYEVGSGPAGCVQKACGCLGIVDGTAEQIDEVVNLGQ